MFLKHLHASISRALYSMKTKCVAYHTLNSYCKQYGIPNHLISDNAGEETISEDWIRVLKKFLMEQQTTKPYSPWQNKVKRERETKQLEKHFRRIMNRSLCSETIWFYGLEYGIIANNIANIANIAQYLQYLLHLKSQCNKYIAFHLCKTQ